MKLKQFLLTPSAGKRLIGKGILARGDVQDALDSGTVVIVAGTTNGYVAEEVLDQLDQREGFTREGFRRGVVVGPGQPAAVGNPKDVVIVKGVWQKGLTIFDVVDDLKAGDVIMKGANALSAELDSAAVLIGDPKAGTAGAAIQAVIGRRVQLIIPVGLEKIICDDIDDLVAALNDPEAVGPRLMSLPGEPFTELHAIEELTGAEVMLVAAGGIRGAEGAAWIAVRGESDQLAAAEELIGSVQSESPCLG